MQSFDVVDGKDGKSAVSPTVSVTEIEGGHRVTINSEGKTDSFDVMDGKDGEDAEGGTVEVDPTLTIEGKAADAKATGDAIKAIGSGGGETSMTDLETIAMLADNDLLPTITDGNGKILTDAKNTIMLRY